MTKQNNELLMNKHQSCPFGFTTFLNANKISFHYNKGNNSHRHVCGMLSFGMIVLDMYNQYNVSNN